MEIEKTRIISPGTHLLTRRRLLAGAAGIAGGPDHAGRGDAGRSGQQPAARQQVRAR